MSISKKLRELVWYKYNKHCAYCGEHIELHEMQVDHIKPKRVDGSDTVDNYNPSCRLCNHYKRATAPEVFKSWLLNNLHERLRNNYIFKVAERFGIVKVEPFNNKEFYYERMDNDRQEITEYLIKKFNNIDCQPIQSTFLDDIFEMIGVVHYILYMDIYVMPDSSSTEVKVEIKTYYRSDLIIRKNSSNIDDDSVDIIYGSNVDRIPCDRTSFIKWLNDNVDTSTWML